MVMKDSWVAGSESWAGTQGRAIAAAYEVTQEGVFAVVGDASSDTTPYATLVTSGFKIPSCVPMAATDELSNKKKYPYSIRMIQPNYVYGRKLMNFVAHYNWAKVAFVHSAGEYGSSYIDAVRDGARLNNITIVLDQVFNPGVGGDRDYRQPVQNLAASGARVFVVAGTYSETTNFYIEAAKQNLTGPEYVWITDGGM
ncbi:periplasmic binding protein-like I [Gaertneriomyces semiglobifer]|nr:periplasmic binding protein-like I [Gaertneriomyces semiglobifer]